MKKVLKAVKIIMPCIIYIACSLLAFLMWKLFNYNFVPILVSSIILLIAGSILAGYFSKRKKSLILSIASVAISTVLLIIAFISKKTVFAYIGVVFSSYLFNINTCLPVGTANYIIYIGYVVSFIVPIALMFLGKSLGNKTKKKPKKKK